MNTDKESMISSYLDGELNSEEKVIFENYMNENPNFLKKVHIMRSMIIQFNNQKTIAPSENFINNLHSKIPELSEDSKINPIESIIETNSNYWFSTNFKATLGFSFVIMFIGIFFMGRMLTSEDEINISNSKNSEENTTLLSNSDSLKTDNIEFPIHQVKGSSTDK